ncbi:glycosyltransferase family 22 protein [Hysterangium stoloniferum]|nr:glycosyltransferase family 22 protein [Hysterangium stoloniferum]
MAQTAANVQHIRLRKPDAVKTPTKPRHQGILQDQLRRSAKAPWTPSFSLAFRMLLLLRVSAAMYSNIQDCDEVFNFWEPLHYLDRGVGFQTWEVSPKYAIRSWAYIILHFLPAWGPVRLLSLEKRQAFFAVRIFLALVSSFCEARFYRSIADTLNDRVGRYMLFMLIFSTGMWNASTAFLPSSFAMYANLLAFSYAMQLSSRGDNRRTLLATLSFAAGAIIGWPFSLLVAVPFVLDEFFVRGLDRVSSSTYRVWQLSRLQRLVFSGLIPVILVDTEVYGRLVIVPWNIVKYNIFGGAERGPDLYGSEPWHFYILNLLLNFNILLPLALLSIPSLTVTYFFDRKRLGLTKPSPDQSSPFVLLALRLAPFYLWLGVLSTQPHKEERFMFPIYPLICFNAANSVYLMRGWLEVIFIKSTNSPYRASKSRIFRGFTSFLVVASIALSVSRIFALSRYYHAPLDVVHHLEAEELPRLLNVTGLLAYLPLDNSNSDENGPRVDLAPIKQFGLRLCFGKEWYRFPGHYLVPDGVDVQFIKSEFDGLLPRHFGLSSGQGRVWRRDGTRLVPSGLNDLNKEEVGQYVDISTCDYLIDSDFPEHPPLTPSIHEPRYAIQSSTWDRAFCAPFLDPRHSPLITRTLWVPLSSWSRRNSFGDYCLLRNRQRAAEREKRMWR